MTAYRRKVECEPPLGACWFPLDGKTEWTGKYKRARPIHGNVRGSGLQCASWKASLHCGDTATPVLLTGTTLIFLRLEISELSRDWIKHVSAWMFHKIENKSLCKIYHVI